MTYPKEYSKKTYIDWHNKNVEASVNIEHEIESLIEEIKSTSQARLNHLAVLLDRIHSFHLLAMRSKKEDISDAETKIQLADKLAGSDYDSLFKTTDSIFDKLWRKNKDRDESNYITTKDIKNHFGDLVRTSIVTSTFSYAEHLATSISLWKDLIRNLQVKPDDYNDIESIRTQQEAKMENGYFAYHLDVLYTDGLRVEVQIYSRLSEVWRSLSHKLYEKVRIGEDVTWGHGAAPSRLVSLGHLLHLAECEVQYLKEVITK